MQPMPEPKRPIPLNYRSPPRRKPPWLSSVWEVAEPVLETVAAFTWPFVLMIATVIIIVFAIR
jgi:hypothetical protein